MKYYQTPVHNNEYLQKNMGIYYEIISDMSYSDMEELFNSGIPYLNK